MRQCRARFPRELFRTTLVDSNSGFLEQKKGEAWINWYTPILTFLMRCNTDVASLLSGTALKSVIAYTTDYITKSPLKTHTIFAAVKSIFSNHSNLINGDMERNLST